MKLSYMAPSWKTPLMDMRPGLPGRPRAGRRCPMNMHEHREEAVRLAIDAITRADAPRGSPTLDTPYLLQNIERCSQPPPFWCHGAAAFSSCATAEPAQGTCHRPAGGRPRAAARRLR